MEKIIKNETGNMRELTLDEMKNITGGLECWTNLMGCVGDLCCISTTCKDPIVFPDKDKFFVSFECGDVEWYLNY